MSWSVLVVVMGCRLCVRVVVLLMLLLLSGCRFLLVLRVNFMMGCWCVVLCDLLLVGCWWVMLGCGYG